MRELRGIAASPGLAIGPSFHFRRPELSYRRLSVADPAAEWHRFLAAREAAREQLAAIRERAVAESGEEQAAIFHAQAMMVEDPELAGTVRAAIEEQGINAEAALSAAAAAYQEALEALDDPYLRARAADLRDVVERLMRNLLGIDEALAAGPQVPSIILARDLAPADVVLLDRRLVLGYCTAGGGPSSHAAILARARGLPAIAGVGPQLLEVRDGTTLLLDGAAGRLLVEPDAATVAAYRARQTALATTAQEARRLACEPAFTRDGRRIAVMASIGEAEEARTAVAAGAEGVGLLRTEFLCLGRRSLPSEEEQYEAYRGILDTLGGRPVVLRTFDGGGDKALPGLDLPREMNPALGLRGIRLCLAHKECFRTQLRAALRAAIGHDLRVMFPMVATPAEVRAARAFLLECAEELRAEGISAASSLEVGIMIEIPAAALLADRLLPEVDFVSIGANDLSQYTFAADRTNAQVAPLASAFQPAVLRLIRGVAEAAQTQGKRVSLCGEVAGEPLAIPLLVGLGLDELSMMPAAIPMAKQVIRSLTADDARQLALAALDCDGPDAVQALVRERLLPDGVA